MLIEKSSEFFKAVSSSFEMQFFLRVLLAGFAGALIGYERESAFKAAGIRTHAIVGIASALLTCVSMYGFCVTARGVPMTPDPSRIAAGIVTGVGFLGTGAIIIRSGNITGLTTAAGLWAVSGIGIAIGAGMCILGVGATILVYCVEMFSHLTLYSIITPSPRVLFVSVDVDDETFQNFAASLFEKYGVKHVRLILQEYHRKKNVQYKIKLRIHSKEKFSCILNEIKDYHTVQSVTIHEQRFSNN